MSGKNVLANSESFCQLMRVWSEARQDADPHLSTITCYEIWLDTNTLNI